MINIRDFVCIQLSDAKIAGFLNVFFSFQLRLAWITLIMLNYLPLPYDYCITAIPSLLYFSIVSPSVHCFVVQYGNCLEVK